MELEEVKDLKWRAELDIANIMSEFEKKTDLKISDIRTDRIEILLPGDIEPATYSRCVELEIKL